MKRLLLLIAVMAAFFCQFVSAQDRTITGKVTSAEDQQTLPGVSVAVKGTTIGTLTDINGNYSLKVPADAKTLVFSFIGMKVKEVEIGTSTTVDVVMNPDVLKLDEVVVTAVAIEREKRSLGYATEQIKGSELTAGQNTNVIGAIQGKVSGVNVSSNAGAPGSSQRVVIRGGSSLLGNNQALFVVDGVPINNSNNRTQDPGNSFLDNDLNNQVDYGNRGNDINPDDIESISVLKGPAATALYGSSASNGAIIITTKKGRRIIGGQPKTDITLSSSVTYSSILKLPTFQNEFGQGDVDNTADDRRENFSWGLPFDDHLRPWGQIVDGKQRIKPYSAIPDNVKDFFDIGIAYNNYLSFAGGTEKSSYFLSASSLNSKGITPGERYDKYTVHFNGSSELSSHFSSNLSINYNSIASQLPSGGQGTNSLYSHLIETARDIPITEGKDLNDPFNKYDDVTGTYGFYGGYYMNPYFIVESFKNSNTVDRIFGSISGSYTNTYNWASIDITDRLGGDFYTDSRYQKWKKFSYVPVEPSPFYQALDPLVYQGKYSQDIYRIANYSNDLMVTFKRQISSNISSSLLLGQNVRQFKTDNLFAQTNSDGGLNLPGDYSLSNSNGTPVVNNSLTEKRLLGYYGELNLSYKNLIFVGFSGRNDKSSTLPTENSNFFYPSVNASFVFSELFNSNMKDNWWTYGKIRASYAKVGNDAEPYVTKTIYRTTTISGNFGSTVFPLNGQAGYTTDDVLGSPDIKPEFTKAFEVGTELGFLKDRLSIDFSYYQNNSTDQIIKLLLPASSGFLAKVLNAGEIENKGIELAVHGTPILAKSGFKWELYGTYTKNNSEVVSLYGGTQRLTIGGFSGLTIAAQVGKPYGALYAIDLKRVDQSDPNSPVVVDPSSGLPLLSDVEVYMGSYLPDYIASFGTTFSYKGFTLNALFDVKHGGVFFSQTKSITDFNGTSEVTAENDRQDHVWPNSVYQTSAGEYVTNTTPFHPYDYYVAQEPFAFGQFIVDASYVKLREASLSYTFPDKWIKKTPFGSATLSVFGNNLLLWTAKQNKYSDPELNSSGSSNAQGFEYQPAPSQRNYGFSLKVMF
jgi:TonB-linked SusC/RagA family outer membrane protein